MAFAENKIDVLKKIKASKSFEDLEKLRLYYLGKKGLIPEALKGLGSLQIEEKKSKGQELNIIKKEIEEGIKKQRTEIENIEISNSINLESIDVTLPPNISEKGKIVPSRISFVSSEKQRILSREIKKARSLALISHVGKVR